MSGGFDLGTILLDEPGRTSRRGDGCVWLQRSCEYRPTEKTNSVRALLQKVGSGQPSVIEDISSVNGMQTLKKEGIRSAVTIPIMAGDVILGLLQLGSRKTRHILHSEETTSQHNRPADWHCYSEG